jgi:plastocyanin
MRTRLVLAGLLCCAFAAADQTVNVGPGIAFSPSSVTVAPGETVTWVWAGVFHSSTSDSQSGAEVWDSGIISTGQFSHTFTTPGTYPYYCSLHSMPGGTAMNGTVQVTGLTTPTPTQTPPPTVTPTFTQTLTPTLTPTGLILTSTPTATAPPSLTPTSPPSTPSVTFTPFRGAVPMLGGAGRLALVLGLIAAAWTLLFFFRR